MTAFAQQWCNPRVQLVCLYYDCTSSSECNGYPTTCL